MAIKNIVEAVVGTTGFFPGIIYIDTDDTLATVTTANYLDKAAQLYGRIFSDSQMALVTTKTSPSATVTSVSWFEVSVTTSGSIQHVSLVPTAGPGSVTLPTIANHIATYTNTTGGLSEDSATAINGGNIQAGLSGTAGYLTSFPSTALKGSLRLVGAASAGDTVTTITNASMAAARTFTVPDGGQSASSFLITDSAGTQTIATGSLALTLGNLTVAAGAISATLGAVSAGTTVTAGTGVTATTGNIVATAGNLVAGSSGNQGTVSAFPAGALAGSLVLSAVGNTGNTTVTISNAIHGQATVYSIPDVGAATGGIVVSTAQSVMKSEANIAVAGGSAANTVTDAFCTTGSTVVANFRDQTTPTNITTVVAGNGSFVVNTLIDPGSSHIDYIIVK